MKAKLVLIALSAILIFAVPTAGIHAAVNPFSVKSVLGGAPAQNSALVSVGAGQLLEFSALDFERRLGLESGALDGLTVASLPDRKSGGLFLDGVEIEAYDFLERAELDRLCFAASETVGATSMGVIPKAKGGVFTTLNIKVMAQGNRPPEIEDFTLQIGRNIAGYGRLNAWDPDGDDLEIRIVASPRKGQVGLSGASFIYEPWHNQTGEDSFVVCAVDSNGAYSAEAVVAITIDKQKRDFYYTDMVVHQSQYAALMLHDAGVYTGQKIGTSYFFEPGAQMNRGEFMMLLITSAGYAKTMTPTVNTGLPNDAAIPSHLKRYLKKAVEEGIISSELEFNWSGVPSRAECVVLTARAAKINDVESYPLTITDADTLPHWSLNAYRDLAAYQMLDLYDGFAHPAQGLTNAYAADLVWQLYKHCSANRNIA